METDNNKVMPTKIGRPQWLSICRSIGKGPKITMHRRHMTFLNMNDEIYLADGKPFLMICYGRDITGWEPTVRDNERSMYDVRGMTMEQIKSV